jgi:pimeloyl-ACP methyl ester carboxylesterase
LARVSTAVLVVMGSKDPDFPDQQAEAEMIADRLGGYAVLIPDAGHYPQSEFPELTSPVVLEFARSVTSGRTDA